MKGYTPAELDIRRALGLAYATGTDEQDDEPRSDSAEPEGPAAA